MAQDEKPAYINLIAALKKLNDVPKVEQKDARGSDEKAKNEQKMFELSYESKKHDLEARKTHSKFVLWVIGIWLTIVLVIIFLGGFCPSFYIADSVLIALIGSTTANVLGFYVIILKYFFH